MSAIGTSRWDFGLNKPKLSILEKKRASRKPYKASDFLESRDTALFVISRYRGSSEPTEAFCLCLRGKIDSKMVKMGILGVILYFWGEISHFWSCFLRFLG